jgi:hypothetical protein
MTWMLVAAALAAGTLATFTDWLFMGVLFHAEYNRYPEVWWPSFREKGDSRAIIYSSILGYLTSSAIVILCAATQTRGVAGALILAVLAWVAGPLVVVVTNGLWIKLDPRVSFAHAMGYLARFILAGIAAGLVLR